MTNTIFTGIMINKRRIITAGICFTMLVLACTRKVAPPTAMPDINKSETADKTQPEVSQKTEDKTLVDQDAEKGKPSTSEPSPEIPTLPPGTPKTSEKPSSEQSGRTIYTTRCNKCHAAKTIKNYTLTQWEGILKKMVPNANLNTEEASSLYEYIRANAR